MTRDEFCHAHWEYYLTLEGDFLSIERYVAFDLGENALYAENEDDNEIRNPGNSLCFSNEFVKQYQAICSEVDVILKTICTEINSHSSAKNMPDYTPVVLQLWPGLTQQKALARQITLQPFIHWEKSPHYKAPDWFPFYNKVKHERIDYYRKANLKNTLNALAGLYLLEIHLLKYIADKENYPSDIPPMASKLFFAPNFQTRALDFSNTIMTPITNS